MSCSSLNLAVEPATEFLMKAGIYSFSGPRWCLTTMNRLVFSESKNHVISAALKDLVVNVELNKI